MSSQSVNQKILSFIKRNKEELLDNTGIDEFGDLMNEIYATFNSSSSLREKVQTIMENLNDDEIDAKFVEGDLRNYIERLVKFVDSPEDPLEKNNLKAQSSSSSEEEDHKGHLKITKHSKRDRSREKEKHKKSSKNSSNKKSTNVIANLFQELQKSKNIKQECQLKISVNDLVKMLTNKGQNNQNNNKNIVFLLNVPKEMRSYSEIETILQGKGQIAKIQLFGKLPSVHFRKPQDAQSLLEQTKFIVHKGVKVEFSATPHPIRSRRRDSDENNKEENERKVIILDEKGGKKIQTEVGVKMDQEEKITGEDKNKQSKEEHELQSQLESLRNQAKSLVVEKIRLVFLLKKRSEYYNSAINGEIEQLKTLLANKKEEIGKLNSLELLRKEVQWLNENYDYTLEVSDLPEQYFKDKTITKVLNEYYSIFGKIDTLQIKLKTRSAHLKFANFESAERAYLSATPQFKLDFLNNGIKKVVKA